MSITDIAATGWEAFWANVTAPGTIGLFIALTLIILLMGFAFRRTMSAGAFALRACSFLLAVIMVIGFLGVLGIDMVALNPLVNWLLEIVHAPLYLPEA